MDTICVRRGSLTKAKRAPRLFSLARVSFGCVLASINSANGESLLSFHAMNGPVSQVVYHGSREGNFDNNLVVSAGVDGIFMVDHRNTTDNSILPEIEKEFGKTVKLAVNTHWHPDHMNGNQWFSDDVIIIAHKNTRMRRSRKQYPSWAPNGLPELAKNALPDLTFDEDVSIHFNGELIKIASLPVGHTDGDIVVMFTESKIAALGDVFNGRGQLSGYDYFSGDPRNYLAELDSLLIILPDDYDLITGHGGIATKDDIVEYRSLYAALIDELDQRRNAGISAEEAAEAGMPTSWLAWLPQQEYDDSGDWLLEVTRRLWADAQ